MSPAVSASFPVGSEPYGIAISPDQREVYAANYSSNNVSVIDTRTNTVIATIPVGLSPVGVGILKSQGSV